MTKGRLVRAAVVLLAIVASIVVARLGPAAESQAKSPAIATASTSTSTASIADGETSAVGRRENAPWQRTARSFISRYPNARGCKTAWLARLRPVVSQDLHRSLKTIRLANLPSDEFGQGQVLQTAEVGGVMRFPLRGGDVAAVDVTVSVSDHGRLRVTGFEPVAEGSMQ